MFYLDEDFENYHYVVAYSDNYLVLSDQRRVYASYQEPEDLNVLVKYFKPSDLQFTTTQTFYNDRIFSNIEVSNSDWSRADISNILFCSCLICVLTIWIYSILSRIFVRGGLSR